MTPPKPKKKPAKKVASTPPPPIINSQHNVEDVAFEGLIKNYTIARDFNMVNILSQVYGRILQDREMN